MSKLGENIRSLRTKIGLTQEELANKIGKSKNVISNWERGDNRPDADTIEMLCDIFKISPNELLGWGKPSETQTTVAFFDDQKRNEELHNYIQLKPSHRSLLMRYDLLSAAGKEIINKTIDNLLEYEKTFKDELQKTRDEQAATSYIKETIPVYLAKAAAGIPLPIIAEGYDLIDKDGSVPAGADFGIVLSGDSMEPEYPDGCTVWVKSQPVLENGDIGVFIIDGEATCKKYCIKDGKCYLVSLNEKYSPIELKEESDIRIAGKVIGHN